MTMGFATSVVICTHNPREDYLRRVIASLEAQTLPRDAWELIVIDNSSTVPVRDRFAIDWHPHARHVHETTLGLTAARLRGIADSTAPMIVFVDDDNVLEPDYLAHAVAIGDACPFLGAWGGVIEGEYEAAPEPWIATMLDRLAIRSFTGDHWSNDPMLGRTLPCGAGLCIRRNVAERYLADLRADPLRQQLDRRGKSLMSTGDTDMVYTAGDLGLGWGNFERLKLAHLIPAGRLDKDYMRRLREGMAASETVLYARRGIAQRRPSPASRAALRYLLTLARSGAYEASCYRAEQRGIATGNAMMTES